MRKVFISYPAILKYVDEDGKLKIVTAEDLKKFRSEMDEKRS